MITRSYLGELIKPIARHFFGCDWIKFDAEFQSLFGQPLRIYWCWHGFALNRFAEDFSLFASSKSISETIKNRFGERAEKLIQELIEYA